MKLENKTQLAFNSRKKPIWNKDLEIMATSVRNAESFDLYQT
jgi:hypothetical protein